MFKSIGMLFGIITEVFTALNIVAKTGTRYAEQFETEANIQLARRKAALLEQQELKEV